MIVIIGMESCSIIFEFIIDSYNIQDIVYIFCIIFSFWRSDYFNMFNGIGWYIFEYVFWVIVYYIIRFIVYMDFKIVVVIYFDVIFVVYCY